ncbi:MAG: hypothetical protein JXA73_03210 [Acidobacteria bacterium]|nr:hypothetical protein [Acidobacteriota bacterium]
MKEAQMNIISADNGNHGNVQTKQRQKNQDRSMEKTPRKENPINDGLLMHAEPPMAGCQHIIFRVHFSGCNAGGIHLNPDAGGNVSAAARALGIERTRLHKRIRALGITPDTR